MSAPALVPPADPGAAPAAAGGTHGSLAAALVAFQLTVPEVAKGNDATVRAEGKGEYTYSYADLADVTRVVVPALAANGLAWSCAPTHRDGIGFVLHYRLMHDSGETLEGFYPLGAPGGKAQATGSAITYGRRYCLLAVTGVAPDDEDDDGRAASQGQGQRQGQGRPAAVASRRPQPTQENRAMDAVHRIQQATDGAAARKAATWVEENGLVDTAVDVPAAVRSTYGFSPDDAMTVGQLASARIDYVDTAAMAARRDRDRSTGH